MPCDEPVSSLNVDLPVDREPDLGPPYMPVSSDVVYYTIDVLRCLLAQWRPPEGIEPDDQAANVLTTATCRALAALMDAHTAYNRLSGAPELVEQIDSFLRPQWAEERLQAVQIRERRPGGKEAGREIVEALLALARKRREHTP